MTVTHDESTFTIKRCAVCKIDLKGRFVFVDERVEEIFGQSMEQLFGKPIAAFLDSQGQEVVKQLLARHHRFETSFDSCQVNLLLSEHSSISANLIFTLCFAAGNPVNYQILIDPIEEGIERTTVSSDSSAETLLSTLAEIDSSHNLADLIPPLAEFIGEPRVAIYQKHTDQLVKLDSSGAPATIPETTILHHTLVDSGGNYSPDDQTAVQKAVELVGEAPSEYIWCLDIPDERYLVRIVLDEKLTTKQTKSTLDRIRLSARFVGRWFNNPATDSGPSNHNSNEFGLEPILQMADLFGSAAMTINAQGTIVASNSMAENLIRLDLENATYRELFIDRMKMVDKDDLRRLNLYMEQAFSRIDPPRFESAALLPDSRVASFTIMRTDLSTADSDLLMIVTPIPEVADAQTTRRTFAMAHSSFDDLQSLGRIASDYTAQLSHEYFSHLDGDGNFVLMCLSSCLDKMMTSLVGYKEMFQLGASLRKIGKTDLNVLMNDLSNDLSSLIKNVRINISHSDLPKVQTDPKLLKTILRLLIGEVLGEWSAEDFKMAVKCNLQKSQATLTLKLPSDSPRAGIDGLHRLAAVHERSSGREKEPNPLGLAIDHLLASLDASLKINEDGPEIVIVLRQPSEQSDEK